MSTPRLPKQPFGKSLPHDLSRSAPALFQRLDGLLHSLAPDIFQPGNDHGVRYVSDLPRRRNRRAWPSSSQRKSYPPKNTPYQQPYRITTAFTFLLLLRTLSPIERRSDTIDNKPHTSRNVQNFGSLFQCPKALSRRARVDNHPKAALFPLLTTLYCGCRSINETTWVRRLPLHLLKSRTSPTQPRRANKALAPAPKHWTNILFRGDKVVTRQVQCHMQSNFACRKLLPKQRLHPSSKTPKCSDCAPETRANPNLLIDSPKRIRSTLSKVPPESSSSGLHLTMLQPPRRATIQESGHESCEHLFSCKPPDTHECVPKTAFKSSGVTW